MDALNTAMNRIQNTEYNQGDLIWKLTIGKIKMISLIWTRDQIVIHNFVH